MNIFLYNRYRKIYKTNISLLYVIYKKQKVYITDYFKKNGVIKKVHKHLIQQKSKKVGGTGILVLCSYNINAWGGFEYNTTLFNKNFNKLINEKEITLLLTQEDKFEDYDTSESVKAYSKDKSGRFTLELCIITSPQSCGAVPRNAIIIKDNEFEITIANLHLEGGRFIDSELDANTFIKYLEIKLALLKEVLTKSPDIILGDFNSVYCKDPVLQKKMHMAQQAYFTPLKI